MIYYFSGTGNSYKVARKLSQNLNDEIRPIKDLCTSELSLSQEIIGLVCPVYGWGLPLYVENLLKELPSSFFHTSAYTFFILTCGDDIGRTDEMIQKIWSDKNGQSPAIFSIRMRNTYICLPGFNIDNINVEQEKDAAMQNHLKAITQRILQKSRTTKDYITPGNFPWIKTYILRPLFNKFLVNDQYFHVNPKLCIHCGKCQNICPLSNIHMDQNHLPHWNGNCTQCLGCYHVCPQHAINFGKYTESKGQVKINF